MKRRKRAAGAEAGFSVAEMAVLLAVMLAFLAGVVLMTGRAVSLSGPDDLRSALHSESEAVFGKLGALLESSEAVSPFQPRPGRPEIFDGIVLRADLDGDGGEETVAVGRSPESPRLLVARVIDGGGSRRTVTLTSLLDGSSRAPFTAEYLDENGKRIKAKEGVRPGSARSLRLRLALRSGTNSHTFTRTFDTSGAGQ